MRKRELMVYRTFPDGRDGLLSRMEDIVEEYGKHAGDGGNTAGSSVRERLAGQLYGCIHELITQAGTYGFHGNLWHCYLTHLLVTGENGYSRGCEMRGGIQGIRRFFMIWRFSGSFSPMISRSWAGAWGWGNFR